MLDVHEIAELERKWEIYNRSRNKNFSKNILMAFLIVIMIVLFFIFLFLYFYNLGASNLEANIKKNNEEVRRMVNEKKVEYEKNKILAKKHAEKKEKKPIENTPSTNNVDSQLSLKIQKIDVKDTLVKVETKAPAKIIKTPPKVVKTETIVISNIDEKADVIEVNKNEKLDNLEYLTIKYNETKSIYFALDIADIYYSKKDYKNSRKWALIANKQDSNNEKSWVLFAKSSYKLGLKEQAINSLNSYLKSSNSPDVRQLLQDIKQDRI